MHDTKLSNGPVYIEKHSGDGAQGLGNKQRSLIRVAAKLRKRFNLV